MPEGKLHDFADHFSGVAPNYAEFRPHYPPELFDWLAAQCPRRNLAWDCATGNGQAAASLARLFEHVTATDASDAQLRNAVSNPHIKYRVATAEASGLPGESADLITVAQAAHWFDLPSFFAEVRRVLRPGGIIAVWGYGMMKFGPPELDRLLDHFYREVVGPFWPPERVLIENRYQGIDFPFPEITAPEFQMKARFTPDSLAGYLRTWSATQKYIQIKKQDPVAELEKQLPTAWPHSVEIAPADWPIFVRAGAKNRQAF